MPQAVPAPAMADVLRERPLTGRFRLSLARGDLTRTDVDAVVNAANGQLQHGGGLAAALAQAGGEDVQAESDAWVRAHGPVPTGTAALTGAGELPALWIIHAVGPVWKGGGEGEDELLRSAVHEALLLARGHRLDSVAFPALSAGTYGFPKDRCARNMLDEIARFAEVHQIGGPEDIRLVLHDEETLRAFVEAWDERWPPGK